MFSTKTILAVAATTGGLAVALGAFGAHALKNTLLASGSLDTYEVAVRYQFYHALALLAIGILQDQRPESRGLGWAGIFMTTGVLLFSGSLYVLALTSVRGVGVVTPVGGLFLLAGWIFLFREAVAQRNGPVR
jgi:uncharacterized membrane protein YgdD (TMEM256/DUF423 family)